MKRIKKQTTLGFGIPLLHFHENGMVLFAAGAVCVVLTGIDLITNVNALPLAILLVGAMGMVLGALAWRADRIQ